MDDPSVIGSTVTLMGEANPPAYDESLQSISNMHTPVSLLYISVWLFYLCDYLVVAWWCNGIGCRTYYQKVVGSIPGR